MSIKSKVLITGGLGNLGSWITVFLSERYDVYVLSKRVENTLDCRYTIIQADITNMEELKLKLNIEFDFCIHTASYNEFFNDNYAGKALSINTLGTRNLIEVLKNKTLKNFIYLSTFHVYGASSGLVTESTDLNPKNDYASTHLFAEYYLKQFNATDCFPFVIFRLTNSYGAPKYINSTKWYLVLNDLVKSAYTENKIVLKGNGKATRDFIWMQDVCYVIEESLLFKQNEIYNLSSAMIFSMYDLAKKVQEVYIKRYNKDIGIVINKNDKTPDVNLKVDNSKLMKTLNIEFQDMFYKEIESIFILLESN